MLQSQPAHSWPLRYNLQLVSALTGFTASQSALSISLPKHTGRSLNTNLHTDSRLIVYF